MNYRQTYRDLKQRVPRPILLIQALSLLNGRPTSDGDGRIFGDNLLQGLNFVVDVGHCGCERVWR